MKNKSSIPMALLILAAFACLVLAISTCRGQTNTAPPSFTAGLDEMASAVSSATNWAIVGGAGRATKGNRDLAFAAVLYNFNNNFGALLGEDYLWAPHQQRDQNNSLKGGLTLKAQIHPFAFLGSTFLTNVVASPFVVGALAQPTGGSSAGVSTITTEGLNFEIASIHNFELVAGAQIEQRASSGFWDGTYGIVHIGIIRKF